MLESRRAFVLSLTFALLQLSPGGPLEAQVPIQPLKPLKQPGFEIPDLGTGPNAWAYTPSGSAWTFVGSAGLAGNGSGFTYANPYAPQGDQVAFIQGGGQIRQTFSVVPERYRIVLFVAQRLHGGVNAQTISIRLDGNEITRFKPANELYTEVVTPSFQVSAGLHMLEIAGLPPATGDHTALLDHLRLQALSTVAKPWSDPATWQSFGQPMPDGSSDTTVPAGEIVLLDTAAKAKTLQIDGELYCADQDLSLDTEEVMVHGRFECGSAISPHFDLITLTLVTPAQLNNPPPMGDKVLGAMGTGVIELHGEPRVSWTQLAATALPGQTSITLASAVDWRPGDQIVLAPTGETFLSNEAEVVTVQSLDSTQRVVTLSGPLSFKHWGETSQFNSPSQSWTVDERAEVGLLSRNFKIQGDLASEANGIGGHLMTMAGTTIHASGLELYRMGQLGLLGRYPFHWHLVENAPGQSIVNSSIHHSFNRCVTVHGTHDTLVADNVCYDFIGHGYFLEDGYELRNTFDGNLGIWAQKPAPGQAILETDQRSDEASNGPAVFWIGHPNNVYRGNAAAGSQGTGFWYGMVDQVTGPSASLPGAQGVNPRTSTFGSFENNRVHSSRQGFSSCRDGGGPFGMEPPNEALIVGLTVSNAQQGVWPCATPQDQQNARFVDLIVANSPNGMQAPNPMTFESSLFVSYTANTPSGAALGGGVDWRAVQVYDQGFWFNGVHFANYDRPAHTVFHPGHGAHKLASNRAENVSFQNSPNLFLDSPNSSQVGHGPAEWGDVIHDLDGSLLGLPGYALVNDHPLMFDATCLKPVNQVVAGYACPYRYGRFLSEHFSNIDPITVMRSDGTHDTSAHIEQRFITEIIVNGPYHYTWGYTKGIHHKRVQLNLGDAFPGDTVVYELLDVPSTYSVLTPGFTQAQDLSALFAGSSRQYYWRDHSLFVRMVASGPSWHAADQVEICMQAGNCGPGNLTLPPRPTISISSPVDGARVLAGSPLTVTATINQPNGANVASAALYLGVNLVGVDSQAPYSWTITGLAPGSYALKLVAEGTNGQTSTAVQQLFVGEPLPRVEIKTPLDGQSFDANTTFTLSYNLHNWLLNPGESVRLIRNDYDSGEIGPGPVSIRNLPQGRHELEVALVDPSGTTLAISDRVTIYSMKSKVIADFEDGVDERTTVSTAQPTTTITTPAFAWGTADPTASRADGEDDINYFDVTNSATTVGQASLKLALSPAHSWAGYTKLEITADSGVPFEVLVVDASNVTTSLGLWAWGVPLQLPPSVQNAKIKSIELRHHTPPTTPNDFLRNHLRQIRLLP